MFIIILVKTDIGAILQNIRNVKFSYLVFAAILGFPTLLIRSYGWNYLKRKQNIQYAIKDSFLMYGAGLYVGSLTPGKIGEASKVLYLKKDGYSLGKSLVSLLLERFFDFVFLLIFIFFGSLFLLNFFYRQIIVFLIVILFSILLFFIFLKNRGIKSLFKKLFYIAAGKHQNSWKFNFQEFLNDIKTFKLKNYLIIFLITVFFWLFYFIQMYLLAQSANIANIPFLQLSVILSIVGFITLIPISILGIGTRDAALIFFLTPYAIHKEQIIAFSSLVLLIYLSYVLIGLICWLIKPTPV